MHFLSCYNGFVKTTLKYESMFLFARLGCFAAVKKTTEVGDLGAGAVAGLFG